MEKESKTRGEANSSPKESALIRESGTRVSKRLPGRFSTGPIELDSSKLTLLTTIGPDKEFFRPYLIAATRSNDIAVADQNKGVKIYDIKGHLKENIAIKKESYYGISATPDRIVVIQKDEHSVKMYKMDDQLQFDFQFSIEQHEKGQEAATEPVSACPYSVVVKKDDTIIVGRVQKMVLTAHRPKDGGILHTIPVPIEPRLLAADDDDRILISDNHTILVVNGSSAEPFIKPAIEGRPAHTKGLCCSKSAVYVVVSGDDKTGHIHQYDKQGHFVKCVINTILLPNGITVTADQQYLAVIKGNTVAIYKDEEHNVEAEDGSMTPAMNCLIQVSQTTTKTSQDTKAPSLQRKSHLQQVLDEVNINLPEMKRLDRRIQLPYIAMGYFNEKGGSLSLDKYGVHLTIPRGAIAPGSQQQVYIYVDPTAPPGDVVEPAEVALSQSVKCGPEGLRFEESVVLSFPHHADFISSKIDKLSVQIRHDDPKERKLENAKPALVTEGIVFVVVDHFSEFSMTGTATPGSGGWLKVGAFGSLLDRRDRQYAFRVHVWKNDETLKKVIEEENDMESKRLDAIRGLTFFWERGNLMIELSPLKSDWTVLGEDQQFIDEEDIRKNPENSVTFNLKDASPDGEGLYCQVKVHQCFSKKGSSKKTGVQINPQELRLSLRALFVEFIGRKLRRGRQQTHVSTPTTSSNRCLCEQHVSTSTDSTNRCLCEQREAGDLCVYCKKAINRQLSSVLHGVIEAHDFGGMSQEAVILLCEHLDRGDNWAKLLEEMTTLPGNATSARSAIESGKFQAKDVLKLFFDVCRRNAKEDREAIDSLVGLLNKVKLERAAEIVKEDLKKEIVI